MSDEPTSIIIITNEKPEPRAKTDEELADDLIAHARMMAHYWATVNNNGTTQERIEGALFSFLAALDGSSPSIPAYDLVARVHESDKDFHVGNGDNWIEDGTVISTMLHEKWHK